MIQDPLLYRPMRNIPVAIIKEKVSKASGIPLELMLMPNNVITARKRKYVTARQISMTLSMKYSHKSLAYVGIQHGNRNYATVLHAVRTINNLIETKNKEVIDLFLKSKHEIKEWDLNTNSNYNKITPKKKIELIKYWIRHKVPLFIRQHKLLTYNKYCKYCGQLIK